MLSTLIYGPSGIGKSTIGEHLAKIERRRHIDTDKEFIIKYGDISEYIRRNGLIEFHQREGEILEQHVGTGDIVSLGGGTLLLPRNQEIANRCTIITLMTDVESLVMRVLADKLNHRPLMQSEDDIRRLYNDRYGHYTNQRLMLHIGQNEGVEEVVRKIMRVQHTPKILAPVC